MRPYIELRFPWNLREVALKNIYSMIHPAYPGAKVVEVVQDYECGGISIFIVYFEV